MSTRRASIVQQRQHPLREHYHSVPADAWISDGAQTVNACQRRLDYRLIPAV